MLICLSVVPTVYADVIDPDEKEVQTSYQIINLDSYPDYVFLLYGYPFLLFTLLFTILVESLVIWIFLRKKQKIAVILFYTILGNCFTLPLATYTYNYIIADLVLVEVPGDFNRKPAHQAII